MTSVEVKSGRHSYLVFIGPGLLADAARTLKERLPTGRCAIISDTHVGPLFGGTLAKNLRSAGFEAKLFTVPTGEDSKNLQHAGQLCEQMLGAGLDRGSFVIGLGGGVIGDLSGFVAAIFERGIPHVQIPTTLLAMVDSSIGGKTGVNALAGKNLIGAIHPPSLVFDDVDVLKGLPKREISNGFAEIIKHAIIADLPMFQQLEEIDPRAIDYEPLVRRNVELKAGVVQLDEHERTGGRALLNFGHTIGHGIERAANYQGIAHGEAVSLGIVGACAICTKRFGLPRTDHGRVVALLQKFGLPVQLPNTFPREKILDALKFDKKFVRGQIRFVVTSAIGSANLSSDVTMDDIREAIGKL